MLQVVLTRLISHHASMGPASQVASFQATQSHCMEPHQSQRVQVSNIEPQTPDISYTVQVCITIWLISVFAYLKYY